MIIRELSIKMNEAGAQVLARRKTPSLADGDADAIATEMDDYPESAPLTETFRNNLVRLRKEHGLSRAALGRMSGLRDNSLYNIEKGLSNARLSTVEKLARALNVQPDELLKQTKAS